MSELLKIGDELTLNLHHALFADLQRQYLTALPPGSRALHVQAFPGVYDTDDPHHRLLATSDKLDDTRQWLAGFLVDVASDRARGIHRQRLRVMPDLGQLVGSQVMELQDCRALVRFMEPAQDAGEQNRCVWLSDIQNELDAMRPESPPIDHYLEGVEQGIPRGSLWTMMPRRSDGVMDMSAVIIMSYLENHGPSFLRAGCVDSPAPDSAIARYAHFWRDIFDSTRSVTIDDALDRVMESV